MGPARRRGDATVGLSLAILLGIACHHPPAPIPAGPRAPPVAFGHRLARVTAARASLARVLGGWPRRHQEPDCLVVVAERGQWLLGCEALFPRDGYVPTGERLADQVVRWSPRSFVLNGTFRPYAKVEAWLIGLTVGVADRSGERSVLIMHDWEDLHRHDPFRDQPLELWLASFVHESFHAYQAEQPRMATAPTRRERHLAGPFDLAAFYLANTEFRVAVAAEYQHLRDTSLRVGGDRAAARAALAVWLDQFRGRQGRFGPALEAVLPGKEALLVERFLLFHEGCARYVEAKLLSDPPPAALAIRDEPDFRGFTATRGVHPAYIAGIGTLGKSYFYPLGMYLCLLLDVAEPDWKARLFTDDDFLVAAVERAVAARP
jgi:hypothetical protein